MTIEEHEWLMNEVRKIRKWDVSTHLIERIKERGGRIDLFLEVLREGELIEYHQKDGLSRILLRGKTEYEKSVACIVYQFEKEKVITIYWNKRDDNHATLKKEAYDSSVSIIELMLAEKRTNYRKR